MWPRGTLRTPRSTPALAGGAGSQSTARTLGAGASRVVSDRGRAAARAATRPRLPPLGLALAACLALAGLSLLLPSTLAYDPWAWVVWGRETAALALDTRFGPSWKPLPVLFTTPFSAFGEAAPALWLVVARGGALLAVVAAFRLAARLAGPLAGVLAGVFLALSSGYLRGSALGYSEGVLAALVLLAIERHLGGRRGQALALGFGAALLRPETWPFLGLYMLFLLAREPRLRAATVALALALPALWLGPELWGSGDPLRAASRAQDPTLLSPAFAANPALAVLERAATMTPFPAVAGAVLAAVIAAASLWSRRAGRPADAPDAAPPTRPTAVATEKSARPTLALVAGAAASLALVALMTEAGYAGNSRYLQLPVALCCAVGGVGLGWLARAATRALAGARDVPSHVPSHVAIEVATTAAAVLACAPLLVPSAREVAGDAREVAWEARLNAALPEALARAGGRERVLACGKPYATAIQVPLVAWHLRVSTGRVGIEPRAPGVLFRGPAGLQPPDAPAPSPTAGGLRPVARVGGWTVSAAC